MAAHRNPVDPVDVLRRRADGLFRKYDTPPFPGEYHLDFTDADITEVMTLWELSKALLPSNSQPRPPKKLQSMPGAFEAIQIFRKWLHENFPPALDVAAEDETKQFVTLDQMAAMVGKSKRTLERYKNRTGSTMPPPVVEGGGGRADEWIWSQVRPWLEAEFHRKLPEKYPRHR